ncbi:dual specificity mitogen-activated protein kinase kinase 5-like isoform 1 [Aphelenchoides avenae]|nr:dual specificity mitogen-activated protein kinase kinase 5-like isoform 1 [Aphelenchus avenae]
MVLTFIVSGDGVTPPTDVEIADHELMFFDVLITTLCSAAGTSDVDFFEYYDEDGDAIVVRSDDELQTLLASYDPTEKLRIRLSKTIFCSTRCTRNCVLGSSQCCSASAEGPETVQLNPDDLQLLERLSDGQFGTVYKALDVRRDTLVAVKSIAVDGAINTRMSLLNEIEILKTACSNPYVVEFYAAMFVDNELLICLELMDGLSMDRYGKLPPVVLGAVSVAVVNGLGYLWSRNIIHRDIKPSNFLVNTAGDVKLSDFGVSKQMAQSVAWSYVGTKVYMAPERLGGDVYKIHSDIWSLGLSLVEMAIGRFPLTMHNQSSLLPSTSTALVSGAEAEVEQIGADFRQFVSGCLKHDPMERLRPEEVSNAQYILGNTPVNRTAVSEFIRSALTRLCRQE